MEEQSEVPGAGQRARSRKSGVALEIAALALVVAVIALAFAVKDHLPDPKAAGYPAIFVITLLGSSSIFIPLPGLVATCAGGAFLIPLVVGLVAGMAEGLGETTGYLAGLSGRRLVQRNRTYQRVAPWVRRRGWMIVFALASFPNPLFDVVGVAAGAARVPYWQFLLAACAGKTIKSTGVAYACAVAYDVFRVLTK
ncbi:MAG: VTT domain-containing protein [Chloroflexi bacterium]|nr:VTT domain-containing protein [Chloroflexota bacterium]